MFGIPRQGEIQYSKVVDIDLGVVRPSVAGPKRPQDRIELPQVKSKFHELLHAPLQQSGYNKALEEDGKSFVVLTGVSGTHLVEPLSGGGEQAEETTPEAVDQHVSADNTATDTEVEMMQNRPTPDQVEDVPATEFPRARVELHHGSVVIAAITSCTNTSNPSVMLAAGLVAQKAVEKGLKVAPYVKTSLAPGSRVVTEYLNKTGLQPYLDQIGFHTVGYGCTTCIGNSGPLEPHLEETITGNDLVVASVLSGNRNFEARVHQNVKANFLMSPPLVVAYALAGRVDIDLSSEPIGQAKDGSEVYLRDLWPTSEEIGQHLAAAHDPETFRRLYRDFTSQNPLWGEIPSSTGKLYEWDEDNTYIQQPPYFDRFGLEPEPQKPIRGARALAIFGDSVTTDHISPAGAIKASSPAGVYLQERCVDVPDFNSYGSRRGNDRVMVRGTFANVRIKNLMAPGTEGGVTLHQPDGEQMSIYDAAVRYQSSGVPLVILAGQEYGTGSSRDWAAKGTLLLGVRVVIAQSFERIHRSNLIGMGVLPCQFKEGDSAQSLGLNGTESFDIVGLEEGIRPRQNVTLVIHRPDGEIQQVEVILRIDTPIEVEYYQHGGILPFVLRQLIAQSS
jgi:aconitate hydratase